jgi:hypothetical protein
MTLFPYGMSFPTQLRFGLIPSFRHVAYLEHISALAGKLHDWKEQRLPPPRVSQSTVGLVFLPEIDTETKGIV